MWKPTMAARVLLSLLLALLAMSIVGGAAATAGAGGSPSWCVGRPDAPHAVLQSTLDFACANGADCAPLLAGAPCHSPNTLLAHCSYAANNYFHRIRRAFEDATCDFGGAANLSRTDPSSETCKYPASGATGHGNTASSPAASKAAGQWCVCRQGQSDAALKRTLDYACGHGADCDALRPGGPCRDHDMLLARCSYAANSYFHANEDAACDFGGAALLSSTDPSSGSCKYPAASDEAMGPAMVAMLLPWFLLGVSIVFAVCIVLLCLDECSRWSSTRATVSGGAAVQEETGAVAQEGTDTAAVAVEERPMSTCPVCLEACTNQGPHRVSCIPCGHVYGRSCLEIWLSRQRGNSSAKCPSCGISFRFRDIINLYGQEASASTEPAITLPLQQA